MREFSGGIDQTPLRHGHKTFISGLVPAVCFWLGPKWPNFGFSLGVTECWVEFPFLFDHSMFIHLIVSTW